MGTNVSVYLSDEALAKLDAAVTKQAAEDQALGLSGRKVASRSSVIERLIRENLDTQPSPISQSNWVKPMVLNVFRCLDRTPEAKPRRNPTSTSYSTRARFAVWPYSIFRTN